MNYSSRRILRKGNASLPPLNAYFFMVLFDEALILFPFTSLCTLMLIALSRPPIPALGDRSVEKSATWCRPSRTTFFAVQYALPLHPFSFCQVLTSEPPQILPFPVLFSPGEGFSLVAASFSFPNSDPLFRTSSFSPFFLFMARNARVGIFFSGPAVGSARPLLFF